MQSFLKPYKLQEFLEKCYSFDRHVITVQVMAVTDMSPAHKYTIRTALKGSENEMG